MSVRHFVPLVTVSLCVLFTTCDQSPLPVAPDSPGIVAARGGKPAQDQIVFMSGRVSGEAEVFLMNSDGTGLKNLSQNPAFDGSPEWSPDGKTISFLSVRDGQAEVYTMKPSGSRQTRLTTGSGFEPRWSPDGTRIAFNCCAGATALSGIYVMNSDGSGQTRLTNHWLDGDSNWSPDGTRIAFKTERDGNKEVYVMNADGSGQTNLTNNSADDRSPRWSPDGSTIAFVSVRDGNDEIYVMNVDGSGQTNLTNNVAHDRDPRWAPDGAKIAFETWRDGNAAEVYVMYADGAGPTNLTGNAASDRAPQWSPDGTRIAFQSFRDNNGEIYVMNADGSGQTNLTNHPSIDQDARWKPLPCAGPCGGDGGGETPPRVKETDLSSVLGGVRSRANDVDGKGQIVGRITENINSRLTETAFLLTSGGSLVHIAENLGFDDSRALAISSRGEVVGAAIELSPFRQTAFVWSAKAGFRELSQNLPGFDTFVAEGISRAGVIVGRASSQATSEFRAVVWMSETADPTDVGPGSMFAISDNGIAVGWDRPAARATIWTASDGNSYLPRPPEQSGTSRAYDVNSSGDAVGFVEISIGCSPTPECRRRAVVWRSDGAVEFLGSLTSDGPSVALGISDNGLVVGEAEPEGGGRHAFQWTSSYGMIDLGDRSRAAEGVNDRGKTVGWGPPGEHARLWEVK